MPRILNSNIVSGQGAYTINYNDVARCPGGCPAFVSGCQIVGNATDGSAILSLAPTGPVARLWQGGAGLVYAGAGTIAAGLQSGPGTTRLMNTATGIQAPITIAGYLPLDVDQVNGWALLTINRQSLAVWMNTNGTPNPSLYYPTPQPIYDARLQNGLMAWATPDPKYGNAIKVFGMNFGNAGAPIAVATRPGNCYQPFLFSAHGQFWVLYATQNGTVYLHSTTDASQGHQTAPGNHFGLFGEVQPDGTLLVASCANAGETPGSLQLERWSFTDLQPLT